MQDLRLLSELQRLLLKNTHHAHEWNAMPSFEEKQRRKSLKQAVRQAEYDAFLASLPMIPEQIKALFDFIDQQLSHEECDNTLRHTLLFLSQNGIEPNPVIEWLEKNHGFCDCEVLANTEEKFLEVFSG
jgi:hypothetical protein